MEPGRLDVDESALLVAFICKGARIVIRDEVLLEARIE